MLYHCLHRVNIELFCVYAQMYVCQCLAEASVDSCVVCVYLGSCRRCPVNWLPLKKLVPQRGSSSPMWSCHQWPHLHLSLTGKKQTVSCTFL